MAALNEFTFRSGNGKNDIYVREWTPNGEARAVLQIAHGVAEHIVRYDDFAQFMCDNGFIVAGNDHLGHGRSAANEDELGYFGENGGWQFVVSDMRSLTTLEQEKHPGLPYFLLGHSMGSFLTRTYIINWRTGLDGVILSGTGQQGQAAVRAGETLASAEIKRHNAAYKSQRLNNLIFGGYNDGIAHPNTASDWTSRDEASVDKYVSDPLCGFIPSVGLFRDMMQGIRFVSEAKNLERMKKDLPVFFFSGDADPVGEMGRGVIRIYKKFLTAGMTDVTLKLYHEGRHEMLNEKNKEQVYNDCLNWLEGILKR